MADGDVDFAAEADRLRRLAAEFGDARFTAAAEAVAELRESERDRIRDVRDVHRMINDMARRFSGDLASGRAKAHRIHDIARAYVANRWPADRDRLRVPPDIADTAEAIVWRVLKWRGEFPGFESVRKILSGRYYAENKT